ncbi:MAG: hypothetical protein EOP10_01000 [Proteobacteria bacterium]|nr:MAG: hypothetical protein EOP10_01000 [Pseudomonadota bacterium]
MRSTLKTKSLTGSALLNFNPQALWRKAFRDGPTAADIFTDHDETPLPQSNRLIHTQAIYLSEPDDVRKCLDRLVDRQVINLVLTNKIV